jgi:NAD(P)-dependent dehydrogenase (short-subunit alcohol dehydrogenase family)
LGDRELNMNTPKQIDKPADATALIVCLSSDGAHWITGASIPVDGGC